MSKRIIRCAILTIIVLPSCQRGQSVPESPSGSASRADFTAQAGGCSRTWLWLKDPTEVDRLRGIDLSESNFKIHECREGIEGISKAELERMAHELDALVTEDRAKFETDWHNEGFRRQVTNRLNELLGRQIVEDWSADLWKMSY